MMIFSHDYSKPYIDTPAVEAEWKYSLLNLAESERPLRSQHSGPSELGNQIAWVIPEPADCRL